MARTEIPPVLSEPVTTVDLVSVDDSKIVHVSLYSGRAEITRLFKLQVKTGYNQVNINGLPNVLDRESIRVEGKGAATIHDVTLSDIPQPPKSLTSEYLEKLLLTEELTKKALGRASKSLSTLESYLSTLNVEHSNIGLVDHVLQHYNTNAERLDKEVLEFEKALQRTGEDIKLEKKRIEGTPKNVKLGVRVAVGVFAAIEGEVEILLIYGVRSANWTAGYDIRVNMQTKEQPVTLVYKASITQDTGESWDDVPLTLETASPTFGLGIPTLSPWTVSVQYPRVMAYKAASRSSSRPAPMLRSAMFGSTNSYITESALSDTEPPEPLIDHRSLAVTSRGGVSATYEVPGSITIPSDGAAHNVTVAQLKLDATMSWITVPKVDSKTHLRAKIKNASEYTFLPGAASVYVDGSFISRSNVPLVSPQESFDCPLGLDPSIRVTYHPQVKKISHSGFYTKTHNYIFTQRITVFNTKTTSISDFKVIDQMPVSDNSQITVKILSPALVSPDVSSPALSKGSDGKETQAPPPVKTGEGVFAQWEGADEPGFDMEALGKDGKLNWVCSVPSQGKVNLVLSWEVTVPARTKISGLD